MEEDIAGELEPNGSSVIPDGIHDITAQKSWGIPETTREVEETCGEFVVQHYLDGEFSDRVFTDYLKSEIDRRREALGKVPEEGLRNFWFGVKKQSDDSIGKSSAILVGGAGGGFVNFLTRPEFVPGYVIAGGTALKGAMNSKTAKNYIDDFRSSLPEQKELYEEAKKGLEEEGHSLDVIEVEYDPIIFPMKKEKYIRTEEDSLDMWEKTSY